MWIALFIPGCSDPTDTAAATHSTTSRSTTSHSTASLTTEPGSTTSTALTGCDQDPTGDVTLPADDAAHPEEPVEWWYWTGHLTDDAGRWYGFEQVFFQFAYGTTGYMLAHHAVTYADTFSYDIAHGVGTYETVNDGYALSIDALSASGSDGVDTLHGELEDTTLDLDLTSRKAPANRRAGRKAGLDGRRSVFGEGW